MPKALRKLALKLLCLPAMGFTEKPRKVVMSRIATCSKLAARGRKEVFRSLAPDRLETKEAVLPSGILILLLKNVSQDITKDTMDTQSTYSEYILKLVSDNILLACSTSKVDPLLKLSHCRSKTYSGSHTVDLIKKNSTTYDRRFTVFLNVLHRNRK